MHFNIFWGVKPLILIPMQANVNQAEVNKFSEMAPYWWDPEGVCKPLHLLNPLRLSFITKHRPLSGIESLDIGCGGGLLSEALAKQHAKVTAIDASETAISVAENHAKEHNLQINYHHSTAEQWLSAHGPSSYELISCMELIEHVPDPGELISTASQLLVPGGCFFLSTLNRTVKSYLGAIIGAEYLLKWLPKGTHDYASFLKPSEIATLCRQNGLKVVDLQGISYHPLTKHFQLSDDVSINYLLAAVKEDS